MDKVYQLFDKFTNMIPANVIQVIRLGAILAWLILATVATVLSWQSGVEATPELGQALSLSNIKEEIARKNNLKKTGDIVLPDLNDLIRQQHGEKNQDFPVQSRPEKSELIDSDSSPIESSNPIRAFNERDTTPGPVYQGETSLPVFEQKRYVPLKDQGAGGVREQADNYNPEKTISTENPESRNDNNSHTQNIKTDPLNDTPSNTKKGKTNLDLPYLTD